MSYGNHINYNTGQPCDCSLAIYCGHYRDGAPVVSMSPADILAAVRTLPGVKEVQWCSRHQVRWGYAAMCGFSTDGTCPRVPSLVVPLSEEE